MGRNKREFKSSVRRDLAERVAYMCSNPLCRNLTIKRRLGSKKAVRSGKACHIHSAGQSGPRFKADMTDEECSLFENGIWACDKCSREIDDNDSKYTADELRLWKKEAEEYVEELVTQDTRLRQLRVMMSPLLSTLRILTALPGPGPRFDHTFEHDGRISLTRILIEAEQTLFENGFRFEAEQLLCIGGELERVYDSIRVSAQSAYLDISKWKNQRIRTLMVVVMRFTEESYRRYLRKESEMVQARLKELETSGTQVIQFKECLPNGGSGRPAPALNIVSQ